MINKRKIHKIYQPLPLNNWTNDKCNKKQSNQPANWTLTDLRTGKLSGNTASVFPSSCRWLGYAWSVRLVQTAALDLTCSRSKCTLFRFATKVVERIYWACNIWRSNTTTHLPDARKIMNIPLNVRLCWLENTYSRPLFRQVIMTRKVGYTDLDFGVRSGFISGSAHARLQVSVCRVVVVTF